MKFHIGRTRPYAPLPEEVTIQDGLGEITFETLEQMLAFCDKHGDLIIFPKNVDGDYWLEIYDDYRE